MASPLLPSRALLRLPPSIRLQVAQRAFSSSPSHKMSLVDIIATPPTIILDTLHAAGLPWYAVLPASAVFVRGVITYYISSLPSQRAAQQQSALQALAMARVTIPHSIPSEEASLLDGRHRFGNGLLGRVLKSLYFGQEMRKLHREYGVPKVWWRTLLNFSGLIAMTEAIRMKCGSRHGLLSFLLEPFEWLKTKWTYSSNEILAPQPLPLLSREEHMAQRLELAKTVDEGGNTVYDFSSLPPVDPPPLAYAGYFDPTLQTEGLAWATDLSSPDPTLVLPVVLWVAISLNIIYRPWALGGRVKWSGRADVHQPPPQNLESESKTDANPIDPISSLPPPRQPNNFLVVFPPITNGQRLGLSAGLVFLFLALKLPVAVLLYMIPSLGIGWLQRRWLGFKLPVRQPIRPCTRPLRVRVKRKWED